ncbi:MAG: hypothetical protein IKE73_01385 [Bacilli bacterium]|nr:hypothetical protein [Bacilli bacterium]
MSKENLNIEEIKRHIYLFEDGEWENNFDTNCYAYALGLDYPEKAFPFRAYQLGVFGAIRYGFAPMDVCFFTYEDRLKFDLKALKIKYREIDPEEKTFYIRHDKRGENYTIDYFWSIALFDNGQDFHFLRKGFDDKWYHKYGYFSYPFNLDRDNKIILDPRECNLEDYEYRKTYQLKLTRKSSDE